MKFKYVAEWLATLLRGWCYYYYLLEGKWWMANWGALRSSCWKKMRFDLEQQRFDIGERSATKNANEKSIQGLSIILVEAVNPMMIYWEQSLVITELNLMNRNKISYVRFYFSMVGNLIYTITNTVIKHPGWQTFSVLIYSSCVTTKNIFISSDYELEYFFQRHDIDGKIWNIEMHITIT